MHCFAKYAFRFCSSHRCDSGVSGNGSWFSIFIYWQQMVFLLHENQVYRGLLPTIALSNIILCLLIVQVEELVENLAKLEVIV